MEKTLKTVNMSPNGATKQTLYVPDKLITVILSILTAAVIGCFSFLWNVNSALARMEERETEAIRIREEMRIRINSLQLDVRDVRERIIRIESINHK